MGDRGGGKPQPVNPRASKPDPKSYPSGHNPPAGLLLNWGVAPTTDTRPVFARPRGPLENQHQQVPTQRGFWRLPLGENLSQNLCGCRARRVTDRAVDGLSTYPLSCPPPPLPRLGVGKGGGEARDVYLFPRALGLRPLLSR